VLRQRAAADRRGFERRAVELIGHVTALLEAARRPVLPDADRGHE
jgi:hypothetical protein